MGIAYITRILHKKTQRRMRDRTHIYSKRCCYLGTGLAAEHPAANKMLGPTRELVKMATLASDWRGSHCRKM